MPIVDWDNPWSAGSVPIVDIPDVAEPTLVKPRYSVSDPNAWQMHPPLTEATIKIGVPVGSLARYVLLWCDVFSAANISPYTYPLFVGATTDVPVEFDPLSCPGWEYSIRIEVRDSAHHTIYDYPPVGAANAYLNSIIVPSSIFWTSLIGCKET